MKKLNQIIFSSIVFFFFVFAELSFADMEKTIPTREQKFIDIINEGIESYNAAEYDSFKEQKARKTRKDKIEQLLGDDRSIIGWLGIVEKITITGDDDEAYLTIVITDNFSMKTWSGSDEEDTLVRKGSSAFEDLFSLEIGMPVIFSGEFLSSEKDFIKELSWTRGGSMQEPEFAFRFFSIMPYEIPSPSATVKKDSSAPTDDLVDSREAEKQKLDELKEEIRLAAELANKIIKSRDAEEKKLADLKKETERIETRLARLQKDQKAEEKTLADLKKDRKVEEKLLAKITKDRKAEEKKQEVAAKAEAEEMEKVENSGTCEIYSEDNKNIAVIPEIEGRILVRDAAISQKGCYLNLAIIVDYSASEEYAKELGEDFIRLTKTFGSGPSPGKEIGKGVYDYLVGIYYPNEKLLAMGAKVKFSSHITW